MYCANCGKEIEASNKFCPSCGIVLTSNTNTNIAEKAPDGVSIETIKEHLKNASILEKRIYELNNLIRNISNKINDLQTLRVIQKQSSLGFDSIYALWAAILFVVVWIIASLILVFGNVSHPIISLLLLSNDVFPEFKKAAIIAAIIAAIPLVIGMVISISEEVQITSKYNKSIKARDIEYAKNLKQAAILEKEKKDLLSKKKHAEQYLKKVYDKDILFPKYRNMVAVLTMLEYFMSGRCNELTGYIGAYNIYESELRQNIIISSLEAIQGSLEQIKQNQYMLYQAIQDAQDNIKDLSYVFNNVSSSMNSIQNSAKVSAYNAKIAAENTKLLSYIELVKY